MQISIDGRDDILFAEEGTTVREVVDEILDLCGQAGRQIEQLLIDGRKIDLGNLEEELRRLDANAISFIEVQTSGKVEQALDMLDRSAEKIATVEAVVEDFLRKGGMDYQDLVFTVITVMNLWENICRDIDNASRLLDVSYVDLEYADRTFLQHYTESMEIISSISCALSNRDIVTGKDLIEYKLLPKIKTFSELIKIILEKKMQDISSQDSNNDK